MPLVTRQANTGNLIVQDTEPADPNDGDVWTDLGQNPPIVKVNDGGTFRPMMQSGILVQGDLNISNTANELGRLAIGTALQQLRVNAGATALEWAAGAAVASTSSGFPITGSLNAIIRDTVNNLAYIVSQSPTQPDTAMRNFSFADTNIQSYINWTFATYATQGAADTAWPSTDTAKDRVNITNDEIDFDHDTNSTPIAISSDLEIPLGSGINLSDTLWRLRFKLRFSVLTQTINALLWIGLSDTNHTIDAKANQDFIGIRILNVSGTTNYGTVDSDGGAITGAPDNTQALTWAIDTDYFIEIRRTSATAYTINIFLNSDYSTSPQGEIAGTSAATTIGLRYLKILNLDSATAGVFTGTIDDIEIWDNTNSI